MCYITLCSYKYSMEYGVKLYNKNAAPYKICMSIVPYNIYYEGH